MGRTLKHRETHPNLDVEGCFGCRIAHFNVSAEAMPTRKPGSKRIIEKERVLHKDLDAYHRLRQDGQQPKRIDGAAIVEKRAEENWQVATGIVPDKTNIVG
jgi:hypothetical protein|tara:strand:+ start:1710 stop:2012 length:303 start_codon:yes stop_codon:yes gene_type:complete